MIEQSQRQAARVYAVATLLTYAVIMISFPRYCAPFLVWDHEPETARNFIAHAQLLHEHIAASAVYGLGMMVILTAFYSLFRQVNRGLALFAAFTRLVYVVMWFIWLMSIFSALRTMGDGGYVQVLDPQRLQALAGLQLAAGWDAYYIALSLHGLGAVVLWSLFFQSRYIPRILSALGVLASLFEGSCGFCYLLDRSFENTVSVNWYELPTFAVEIAISIWILVRGLRLPRQSAAGVEVTA